MRAIYTPTGGCGRWLRDKQMSRRHTNTFRKRLFTLCMAGQLTTSDREPSVGDSVSLFREPDAGNLPGRETTVTAPVLDSTVREKDVRSDYKRLAESDSAGGGSQEQL
jgi:hypothetical protein